MNNQLSILEERYHRALKIFGRPPDIIIISKEHADMVIEELPKGAVVHLESDNMFENNNKCYFRGVRVEII